MPRDASGFLKMDALRAGVPDQYAVEKGGAVHVVEIVHDRRRGGVVVLHRVTPPFGEPEVTEWQVGDDRRAARAIFRREVRALGGRA